MGDPRGRTYPSEHPMLHIWILPKVHLFPLHFTKIWGSSKPPLWRCSPQKLQWREPKKKKNPQTSWAHTFSQEMWGWWIVPAIWMSCPLMSGRAGSTASEVSSSLKIPFEGHDMALNFVLHIRRDELQLHDENVMGTKTGSWFLGPKDGSRIRREHHGSQICNG